MALGAFRRGASFPVCVVHLPIARRVIASDQTGELQLPDRGAGGAAASSVGRAESDLERS
jgi:hypothetical protein